jgi:hypothetical protein
LYDIRYLELWMIRGFDDLSTVSNFSSLLTVSHIEDLSAIDMCHLKPGNSNILKSHPSLNWFSVGIGGIKKNTIV